MQSDTDALKQQRVEPMLTLPTTGAAVLLVDATGFLKHGQASVGVARQSTGTAGKVTTCQVALTCQVAERTMAWPLAVRLYLPQAWCADLPRRTKAHIPEAIQFQTKSAIALALLSQARAGANPHTCLTAAADSGANPNFLSGLERRDERSGVAIRADLRVALAGTGEQRLQRVDAIMAARATRHWRTIGWRKRVLAGWRLNFMPCAPGAKTPRASGTATG